MNKSTFLSITILLAVNFWDLKIFDSVLNRQTNPVFAIVWALLGLFWFRSRADSYKKFSFKTYNNYFYLLAIGFFLSVIPAYVYWNQDFLTSLIANRHLIWYIYLPLILYIQPKEKAIINALTIYTVIYMAVWFIQSVTPYPLTTFMETKIELGIGSFSLEKTEFGYLIPGYTIMLILLYYKIQKFIENVGLRTFVPVLGMLAVFFILQNRGTLFFAIIVFGFAILRLRTRYKPILLFFLVVLIFVGYLTTESHWLALFQETIEQLNNPKYNRWKAFYYFTFDYSPHWVCNIFGNGLLSSKIGSGQFIQKMMTKGYYQSDIGTLGFWSTYGIIPLFVIYSVIIKIVFGKSIPFYLKAMAAHILFVPIAWAFDRFDSITFVFLFYLFAYFSNYKDQKLNYNYS